MGLGVEINESPGVVRVTCPGCGSILDALVETEAPIMAHRLHCPVCGADLGMEGYGVQIYEQMTKQTVTCPGCGRFLELTVSSIPDHNVEQYCPVCSTAAC